MNDHSKPLANVRILVGRARRQASALSRELQNLGADVIEIPFIEIHPPRSYKALDSALKRISEYEWLILTSANGVEALANRMKRLRISAKQFAHLRIAAIGPATRSAIEKLGLKASVEPTRYVAESVVESLRDKVEGKQVLLARAKVARDVIPRELRRRGAKVDVVEAYETVLPESSKERLQTLLKNSKRCPHIVTFTSSSTVRNFVELLGGRGRPPHPLLHGIQFASIGPVTSATIREFGLALHIEATEFTIPGLARAIAEHCAREAPKQSR